MANKVDDGGSYTKVKITATPNKQKTPTPLFVWPPVAAVPITTTPTSKVVQKASVPAKTSTSSSEQTTTTIPSVPSIDTATSNLNKAISDRNDARDTAIQGSGTVATTTTTTPTTTIVPVPLNSTVLAQEINNQSATKPITTSTPTAVQNVRKTINYGEYDPRTGTVYDTNNAQEQIVKARLAELAKIYGSTQAARMIYALYGPGGAGTIEGSPAYNERVSIEKYLNGTGPMPEEISPMALQYFGLPVDWWLENYGPDGTPESYDTSPGGANEHMWKLRTPEAVEDGGYGGEEETEEGIDYGDGEAAGPGEPNWSEQYHIPGAPDWWRGVIADINTPETEYAVLMNAMIPFLSSEDQRAVATNLAMLYPEVFGTYNAALGYFMQAPTATADSETLRRVNAAATGIPYLGSMFGEGYTASAYSKERANAMLKALELVKSKVNAEMGPGYEYLQQVASAIRDFGGSAGNMPTRANLTRLMSVLDPLIAASESETLSAYTPISKMITTPFMSAGSILPITKNSTTGEYEFGTANKTLY